MKVAPVVRPENIERLAMAIYPSFAMLAGMELDVFTTLKDGPLTGRQVAATLGVIRSGSTRCFMRSSLPVC
jgi:hypothetical protein